MTPSAVFGLDRSGSAASRGLGVAVLCMFLNLVDGFDLLIISFVLPNLPTDFATTTEKGFIVSWALVGMAVGAIGLARLADRYGRRLIALVGLIVNVAGLLLSTVSVNAEMMMGARFITGTGIGMVSVVIVVAAQETAKPKYRNLATGLVMIGYPLGSVLAALSTNAITSAFGANWKALFLAGAGLGTVALIAAFLGLPESVRRVRPPRSETVERTDEQKPPSLLSKKLLAITLLLCIGYMTVSGVYNFAAGLTPDFVKTALTQGFDPGMSDAALQAATAGARATGQNVGLWLSAGCLIGAVSMALIGLRVSATRLTWIYSAIAVVSMVGFANSFPEAGTAPTAALYIFSLIVGIGVFGSISAYSAMVPLAYPATTRAKGYGAMLGVGRLGAILAPLVGAAVVERIGAQHLYNYINILLVIALACAVGVAFTMRRRSASAVDRPDCAGAVVAA